MAQQLINRPKKQGNQISMITLFSSPPGTSFSSFRRLPKKVVVEKEEKEDEVKKVLFFRFLFTNVFSFFLDRNAAANARVAPST